ncbi:helix-turn-helix domain-containing protein [Brevibacillus borstelensis]|uniref:helix-turn-helix domain-containing protein n=1 Tax=Brevibacillus borstelensis TaxID=45462 RepID=UPI0030C5C565
MKHTVKIETFILAAAILIGAWLVANAASGIAAYGDSETHNTAEIAGAVVRLEGRVNELIQAGEPNVMDEQKVREYLGITGQDLIRLVNETDFPYIKINGDHFFPKSTVDEWLKNKAKSRTALFQYQ